MIRVGLCQCKLSFEQPEENLAMMERFLFCAQKHERTQTADAESIPCGVAGGKTATACPTAAKRADLLLFPELTLTGFTMKSREFAIRRDSQMIERVREMAVRYQTAVGFGCVMEDADAKAEFISGKAGDRSSKPELRESDPQNAYLMIDKDGQLLVAYAKLHPFSYAGENRHYTPGDTLRTFTLNGVRLGISVCYDLRFPEIYQAYADSCDAILVAANWPAKRAEHWNALVKARAIETQCYIAAVNCVGNMDGQYYRGDSQLTDPDGKNVPCEWQPVPPGRKDSPCECLPVSVDGKEPLRECQPVSPDGKELPCECKSVPLDGKKPEGPCGEGILFAEIDEGQVRRSRDAFPVRQDRRKELYRSLLSS